MRARLALMLIAVLPLACTRFNPAFDELTDTEGELTEDDGDGDGDAESSDTSSQLECELEPGPGLTIQVPVQCDGINPQTNAYEQWLKVVDVSGDTWTTLYCDPPDCSSCGIESSLSFSGLPVGEIAPVDACLFITGRRLGTDPLTECQFETLVVYHRSGPRPYTPAIVARSSTATDFVSLNPDSELAGFNPQPVNEELCDCTADPNACCNGDQPTARYDLHPGQGEAVALGGSSLVTLDTNSYEFWALDAFDPGACDAPMDLAWALMLQP